MGEYARFSRLARCALGLALGLMPAVAVGATSRLVDNCIDDPASPSRQAYAAWYAERSWPVVLMRLLPTTTPAGIIYTRVALNDRRVTAAVELDPADQDGALSAWQQLMAASPWVEPDSIRLARKGSGSADVTLTLRSEPRITRLLPPHRCAQLDFAAAQLQATAGFIGIDQFRVGNLAVENGVRRVPIEIRTTDTFARLAGTVSGWMDLSPAIRVDDLVLTREAGQRVALAATLKLAVGASATTEHLFAEVPVRTPPLADDKSRDPFVPDAVSRVAAGDTDCQTMAKAASLRASSPPSKPPRLVDVMSSGDKAMALVLFDKQLYQIHHDSVIPGLGVRVRHINPAMRTVRIQVPRVDPDGSCRIENLELREEP